MAEIRVVYKGKFVGTLPRPKQRCDAAAYSIECGDPVLADISAYTAIIQGRTSEYSDKIILPILPHWVDDSDNPIDACVNCSDTADRWLIEFAVFVDRAELLEKVRKIRGWKAMPPKRIIELPTF